MNAKTVTILGIESSCDDTAAAVVRDGKLLANLVANQEVHRKYGGVVPELASRAHQQAIVPVVQQALNVAGISINDIDAIAFTRGPGLLGSLLVGSSFAKGLALSLNKPLLDVNHMQGHILAHFIEHGNMKKPEFPFLCLTVSGGHTQLIIVKDYFDQKVIGETLDDAAGEAFDKVAKIMNLPYPGGPLVDKFGKEGNADKYKFPKPNVSDHNFSFSGLKTSFMNFIRENEAANPRFTEENKNDICASIQKTIVTILLEKLETAARSYHLKSIAIAGGVSANSYLRQSLEKLAERNNWDLFIPEFQFCTDNAAMIAIAGYYKYLKNDFASMDVAPMARMKY